MTEENLYDAYVDLDTKLGLDYSKEKSTFKVYAPSLKSLSLRIFKSARDIVGKTYEMDKDPSGIFSLTLEGDYDGFFYSYITDSFLEISDPYSIASMINSKKSAIIDLGDTNPKGFLDHKKPTTSPEEAIIYELHIKDFTFNENSGVKNRGKYLGLGEEKTSYKSEKTGLDHLVDLGISHVHLMPVYDFLTVDEDLDSFYKDENYNWGYDPELYNVPEGSFSTRPADPKNRIKELKSLIMAIHSRGLKVVVDVVYNHTYRGDKSNFQMLCPNYYYRTDKQGRLTNGSGCGNEFRSEAIMARKFILDSIKFWLEEYRVDGFRFDLMGLIDIETMKEISRLAKSIDPDVLLYGEPWLGGDSPLPFEVRTLKGGQRSQGFSCFNDDFRNAVKGSNRGYGLGFISGKSEEKIDVERGIAGSIDFNENHKGFANEPRESINYLNSHDDLILWDKIDLSLGSRSFENKKDIYKLANSILFLSFGLPFIHQGNEFLRTKYKIANTYKDSISINQVDWDLKVKNKDVYKFFKDLIYLRKSLGFFTKFSTNDIRANMIFLDLGQLPTISYVIRYGEKFYFISHNSGQESQAINTKELIETINIKFNEDLEMGRVFFRRIFNKNGATNELIEDINKLSINPLGSELIIIEKRRD